MKDNENKILNETLKNEEVVKDVNTEINENRVSDDNQEIETKGIEKEVVDVAPTERAKTEAEIRAEIRKQMKEEAEREKKEREEERKKREKKYKRRKRILTVASIILFLLLFLNRCSLPLPTSNPTPIPIKEGETIGSDEIVFEIPEDFDSETNQIVCMNLTPVFLNGRSEGMLYIDNDINNRYDQNVKIYLVVNGEIDESQCVYESGRIKPGQAIQYDTLDVDLPAGTYDAIASFYALVRIEDDETGAEGAVIAGRTNLVVTITVME